MDFFSEKEAKSYTLSMMTGYLSHEQLLQKLDDFKNFREIEPNDEEKEYWSKKITELEHWLNSSKYQDGEYPQGLDQLFLDLVEWRASIFALQSVNATKELFSKYIFYSQWMNGATYAVFSILGKLVSKDRRVIH
ncbi:hypothetical protein MAMP_01247 [Methylophaga aminisulfidivorans MP]|uniref:Uncharacterized protein n=1 Tax=Methylophaga aminisulfidivorans MP TaxID=1026882 RepID=F5SYQ0_9GAMM|nr:hypothetical protein [Methylophaga aminisulfidivorans]EGL54535.1 hypothetical protein MAMP_01247 [Methylophaga aminisulfidivorans MP]